MTDIPPKPLHRSDPSTWPKGVRPIAMDELDGIGIDDDRQLYWHGKPVVVRDRLELSTRQSIAAIIGMLAALVIAAAALYLYLYLYLYLTPTH